MPGSPSLRYAPALDGLRALCLLAVISYHAGAHWMVGGFLGVSTFFTLSGFLISSLLLAESEARGRISLGRFWSRRLRRLTPAALIAVGVVVATAPFWLSAPQRERLAGDAVATLVYLVNWQFVRADYGYGLIFTAPSPLQHFWSLAIEAQFYLLWPLVFGLLLRTTKRARARLAVILALALGSVLVGLSATSLEEAQDRLYYGTDARAAELLIGCALAFWNRQPSGTSPSSPLFGVLGGTALLSLVACWAFVDLDDPWLYRGGFALYAILSATVLWAAIRPTGLVPRLLSARWLRWIGKVSYGAYLYHWPVFLFLEEAWPGLGATPSLAIGLPITLLAAAGSYRFVEEPIRRGRMLRAPWFAGAAVAGCLGIALLALGTSPIALGARWDDLVAVVRDHEEESPAERERRIALFGDSMAYTLWPGIGAWVRQQPGLRMSRGAPTLGCGIALTGEVDVHGRWIDPSPNCHDITERWREIVGKERPDVAVVLVGSWETRDWRSRPGGKRLALGDPTFDAEVGRSLGAAMDALLGGASRVVWLTAPPMRQRRPKGRAEPPPPVDPARIDRLNELIRTEAAARAPRVVVVDLGAALERWPGGPWAEDLRPDGVHFLDGAARTLVLGGLGDEIERAAFGER